jgi:hypothetical protein
MWRFITGPMGRRIAKLCYKITQGRVEVDLRLDDTAKRLHISVREKRGEERVLACSLSAKD